ncbi:MAG TPA: thioredoxin family protein [Dictyobacter sp.]|nr:thioredoxin family protein [Dictyobacter sp.]
MADSYIEVTPENFTEQVLNSSDFLIANISAPQSEACKIQEPEFEAISKEYQGRATFARVHVSSEDDLVSRWNIEGVPTLLFFKGGKEIYRISGIVMRHKLRRQIEGILLVN